MFLQSEQTGGQNVKFIENKEKIFQRQIKKRLTVQTCLVQQPAWFLLRSFWSMKRKLNIEETSAREKKGLIFSVDDWADWSLTKTFSVIKWQHI